MAFRKPERELSTTEILSLSLSLYSSKFDLFLVPFILTAILNSFVNYALWMFAPVIELPQNTTEILTWLLDYLIAIIPVLITSIIISWVINTMSNGMVVKMSSELLEGKPATLKIGFDFVLSSLPTLLVSGLVVSMLTIFGLIFFVIPGIIAVIIFSLTVQVIMIERHNVSASLWRSRRMVSNRWLKTLAVLVSVVLLTTISSSVGRIVGSYVISYNNTMGLVIESIISSLAQPIQPIMLTLFYYSLRSREKLEGPVMSPHQYPPMSSMYQPNFCFKCGERLPPDAIFCPKCGANVKS
jgi:hypothetical protein